MFNFQSAIISCTLCYCTAELLSSRGSEKNPFSQNPWSTLMPNLVERYLFTTSPDYFAPNFCILDLFFFFLHFLLFSLRYMREKTLQTTSLKVHSRITPKKLMHTSSMSREGLYQSCINIGEIWNFGFLPFCFSFSLTWDYMGEKTSNEIFSEHKQSTDLLTKIHI